MSDAFGVRGVERVGNLSAEVENAVDGQRPGRNQLKEGLALEKFHGQERPPLNLANVVKRADIGMV